METPGQRIRRRREELGYTHQGLFAKMVGCSQSTLSEIENGFSKKIENLGHAVALHFMFYNFGRIHKTLRVTPAMEAGISDHVWTLQEIAALVKDEAPAKRGPYKKKNSN